jgi:glyoxylase-like metal-dependent hydrolase (beta-lactamase superfamily II)
VTPPVQRYAHGDVEFVQVLDTTLRVVAGDVFPTLPADAALPGRDEVLSLPVFVYVVAGSEGWTVIDAGVGADPPTGAGAGRLHDVLAELGIRRADVDLVVFTHLHPDHIGGAVDAEGNPAFPNARHVTTSAECDFWSQPVWHEPAWEWIGQAIDRSVGRLAAEGSLDMVDADTALSGRLRLRALDGHSPGHVGVELDTSEGSVLFIGDALHHTLQWGRPDIGWRDDADPAAATATRVRLATAPDPTRLIAGAHLPAPGVGRVEEGDSCLRWTPVPPTGG